ncbi:MAG: tyrosyl-tRNA synthetase, tyrosyl-tRNA synthetase, partial [Candidatus Parcubacteria bacterium]
MKIDISPEKIEDILKRGVEDVFVVEDLRKALESGKQLRVKFGIDPTGPKIHIGRASVLRKLRAFQKLGHQIVLIVGDFTAQIGDASDKTEKRPMLSRASIEENMADYKQQIGKILDIEKTEFVYNGDWLRALGFQEISELAEAFTVQQMISRRNFKDRIDAGTEVSLREVLYPLMQGYDSVAIKADIEIGGFDQLFNLKAGRIVQKHYGMKEQQVLTTQMLEGTDGRKMSTSWGNVITIVDKPFDLYGKIMSVRDELITKYFLLATDLPLADITAIEDKLAAGENPRDFKMLLGRTLVEMYHGAPEAAYAEQEFIETFQKGGVPEDIEEIMQEGDISVVEKLIEKGI